LDLKEAQILGEDIDRHWYYRAKAAAITRLAGELRGAVILDVGAGSGVFSRYLLRHTDAAEAWCVDTSYDEDRDVLEAGKPLHYRRHLDAVDATLVLLTDVLEHVDDDAGLLARYVAAVPPGATFLLSVPAFRFLWSGHDVFLEHKRRYTLAELVEVVRRGGLAVERRAYYFGFVFPIAVAFRMAGRLLGRRGAAPRSQLRRHGHLVNAALAALCGAELPLFPFNRIAGLSAFCTARPASGVRSPAAGAR
jgi:SAM-dependent methyltransferase